MLDGKKIADEITEALREEVDVLRAQGITPGLGIVLIGDDPSSHLYVSMKQKMAETLGMYCVLRKLPGDVPEKDVVAILDDMSRDATLYGIIVQIPIPKTLSRDTVCSHIDLTKDIDCLNPENMVRLEDGETSLHPPTAESVARLIEASGRSVHGSSVAVIGSGFFARQITAHLRNKGAVVDQIPFRSDDLEERTSKTDVVVSSIGRPACITGEMIRDGAVVIDVGVTRVDREVVGDVDFESVSKKASAITPVPGGVGPVTVAILLQNVVRAAQRTIDGL